jgi:8-amino-7-oxononanoate synthase
VETSVRLIRDEAWRRVHLRRLIEVFKRELKETDIRLAPSDTPIQPLIIGGNGEALAASAALRERGILVPAIRPPTVPEGTARLRVSLSAAHRVEDVLALATALRETWAGAVPAHA